ncbi:polyamine aminopropyltransferase [Streptomyces sp. H27-D2]|uniref:polyamine aminopropyltransferase n=1 Tax=Streptomyces sp. H27-D2 TaxID=3046304 RepID=UPI002DBC5FD7|nr:polyamine aminopropyltransferase [Streptomyces sp. H27-D2]MEC4016426.1 polyamine aminopropyltransferase [Streptomyces sp. H27-D2]
MPVPAGLGRLLLLSVVFICAACGLVYELELVALASYLAGDSVTQASVVLSVMVFAMGIGSLLAKRLRCRASVGFGAIEAGLALVGGTSAMALHASFAWFGQSRSALVAFSLAIGVLIGAEVPLLMTLIQRIRRQDAGGAVADLFAADYVGALVGGLAFPFLLLPLLGQLTGALVTGAVNAVVGGALVLWLFRRDLSTRAWWWLLAANIGVLALLATALAFTGSFERAARDAVYGGHARVALHTDVQEVVMTGGGADGAPLSLFLDGRLRVYGRDEFRYYEGLVHPAMAGGHRRVLILGGGDGLALREVLRYPDVESVTVVELDPGVVRLARTDPGLTGLNRHSYRDRRVRTVTADAFGWLRRHPGGHPYDVVISDLPDAGITPSTKLYSQEFYGLVRRVLAPDGRLAVHAGPPRQRPRPFWTVDATIRAVGLRTVPYQVGGRLSGFPGGPDRAIGEGSGGKGTDGGSGKATAGPAGRWDGVGREGGSVGTPGVRGQNDWGFLLAGRARPVLRLASDAPPLRSLTTAELRAGERAALRTRIRGLPVSTLMHPRYLD